MKILVEVKTPGNGKTYEIMLDDKLTVGSVKEKIIEEITSFENGCISFGDAPALFSAASRTRLPDHRNIRKAGFCGGQTLILL
jgi:hypothetical protein